jgi:hypothetical protein
VEILIPGHRNDSPVLRVKETMEAFGYIPAWRVDTLDGRFFFICGKCFAKRGPGPATDTAEFWKASGPPLANYSDLPPGQRYRPLVPDNAICEDCGGPAWPTD